MKKLKKALAMILSLAMVLGMSATAFADTPNPTPAKITGVSVESSMPTITAYQIIKYNSNGYYEEVLTNTITKEPSSNGDKDVLTPTAANVQNLYYNKLTELKAITDGIKTFTPEQDYEGNYTGNYTCSDLGLGTWLVVVSGSKDYLYNPAIISVSQTPDGKDYGTLNLNTDTWNNGTETYLKKDEPKITKTAETVENHDTNVVGTQYGDILKFTVTADIPAYTAQKNKTDISYAVKDTLTGLDFVLKEGEKEYPVSVKVGADAASAVKNDYLTGIANTAISKAITDKEKSFTVTGTDDTFKKFIIANSNNKIIIEYYAKVTSTTLINVDKLNNKAELDYSTNSDTTNKTHHKDTETKHYTFGIDTSVSGWKESESSKPTGEFIKINDKGEIQYSQTPGEITKTKTDVEFLGGAEFQLHIGSATGPLFTDKQGKNAFTTGSEGDMLGRLQIVGLDDGVDYYLVETKAPTGYTLNPTPIKVHITATYTEDSKTGLRDVLTGYEVSIGDGTQQKITHYNYEITTGKTELINTPETASNPFGFKNTKLAELPSTGGMGTTIFTIGGCLIMIAAAGLFFASRRKSSAK